MLRAFLLAAGFGTRLRPLTDNWPKCLMPVRGYPLLGYWINTLIENGITGIFVNTHFMSDEVTDFIRGNNFSDIARLVYEETLLGTAGSLRANATDFQGQGVMLIHADNWCQCDLKSFIEYHKNGRPNNCCITMMTFITKTPEKCGIIEVNDSNIAIGFHEKVPNAPGKLANAAVYIIEPEVIEFIANNSEVKDFSTEVLPKYLGRIATWRNTGIHRDIGSPVELLAAQKDPLTEGNQLLLANVNNNDWMGAFKSSPIHNKIKEMEWQQK
jgi:mannose-1-phosphate guanylyltransferase